MKILFVAMAESIHTARWLNQVTDQGWEIHLFSSHDNVLPHPGIKNITIHQTLFPMRKKNNDKNKTVSVNIFSLSGFVLKRFLSYSFPSLYQKLIDKKIIKTPEELRLKRLCALIKKLQPDIIHAMEFQSAGYLVSKAKEKLGPNFPFPVWITTNWGSDIYLFGHLPEHATKIKQILRTCDYYSCECVRDIGLAQNLGLKAPVLPVFPNSGGINLKHFDRFRQKGKTSQRKTIALKGTQNIFGRAFVGLEALRKCVSLLQGYKIIIFNADGDMITAGRLFEQTTGIPVSFVPSNSSHEDILKIHGASRLSIGLSISDAISTAVLEAMAMGSFPIQSNTSCAGEWFQNGQSGFLVPAENPLVIAAAIKKTLKNDVLVDRAAKINRQIIHQRLDEKEIKQKTLDFYRTVLKDYSPVKPKIDWRRRGREIFTEIFLVVWIAVCLSVWLMVGGGHKFERLILNSNNITSRIHISK